MKQGFMEKFEDVMSGYITPAATKIGNNRYLAAIRDGMVGTMGFTIIGSIFLPIATFPFPQSYVDWVAAHPNYTEVMIVPYNLTVGILSIYISFGIGYSLSKTYHLDPLIDGCSSVFSFLTLVGGLGSPNVGSSGMITTIFAAIISVEIMSFCIKKNLTIKMPDQVPPAISGSFASITPAFLTIMLLIVLKYVIGFDLNNFFSTILTPIFSGVQDSLGMAVLYVVFAALLLYFPL